MSIIVISRMKVLFATLIFALIVNTTLGVHCIDENGQNVDWYVLYKIPHIKKNAPNELIRTGYAYLYLASNNVTAWNLSNYSINDKGSFLARTLAPLYDQQLSNTTTHILYNDQPPNMNPRHNKGHTKGLVLGDEDGGIWVVHSVPLFPPPSIDKFVYPQTGTIYGQSVLCISMDADNLNLVGTQLQYNQIEIYSTNMPINLTLTYPKLKEVIDRVVIKNAPWFHTLSIKSRRGNNFLSFAKTKDFAKDLYEDWVAPALKSNLFVETWPNGPGKLASNCTKPFSVVNVKQVKLKAAGVGFASTLDHSKWAVNNATNWACVGDINRAEHQKHRGGGTVCFGNKQVAASYKNTIADVESCAKN